MCDSVQLWLRPYSQITCRGPWRQSSWLPPDRSGLGSGALHDSKSALPVVEQSTRGERKPRHDTFQEEQNNEPLKAYKNALPLSVRVYLCVFLSSTLGHCPPQRLWSSDDLGIFYALWFPLGHVTATESRWTEQKIPLKPRCRCDQEKLCFRC